MQAFQQMYLASTEIEDPSHFAVRLPPARRAGSRQDADSGRIELEKGEVVARKHICIPSEFDDHQKEAVRLTVEWKKKYIDDDRRLRLLEAMDAIAGPLTFQRPLRQASRPASSALPKIRHTTR